MQNIGNSIISNKPPLVIQKHNVLEPLGSVKLNTGKNGTDRYTDASFGGQIPRTIEEPQPMSGTNRILSEAAKNTFSKPGSEIRMQMFQTSDNRSTNAASELGPTYGLNNIKG